MISLNLLVFSSCNTNFQLPHPAWILWFASKNNVSQTKIPSLIHLPHVDDWQEPPHAVKPAMCFRESAAGPTRVVELNGWRVISYVSPWEKAQQQQRTPKPVTVCLCLSVKQQGKIRGEVEAHLGQDVPYFTFSLFSFTSTFSHLGSV